MGRQTYLLSSLLLAEHNTVVCLIPLSERCGINLDDAVLDQCVGTNVFVVGGVVGNQQDTCLASNGYKMMLLLLCLEKQQGTNLQNPKKSCQIRVSWHGTWCFHLIGKVSNHEKQSSEHVPLTRTGWILFSPILVNAGGRPMLNFLFFLHSFCFPPVALRLCTESLEIPKTTNMSNKNGKKENTPNTGPHEPHFNTNNEATAP